MIETMSTAEYKEKWIDKEHTDEFKQVVATIVVNAMIEQLPAYTAVGAIVKRRYNHPDDWYLYHMAVRKKNADEWAYFASVNLTTGSINTGYYNLTYDEACAYLNEKGDGGYIPSAEAGDYSPSCPWNAPGMSISDFI